MKNQVAFTDELCGLINRHSLESGSNTPDFILADFLFDCAEAFDRAVKTRETWYAGDAESGQYKPQSREDELEDLLHKTLPVIVHAKETYVRYGNLEEAANLRDLELSVRQATGEPPKKQEKPKLSIPSGWVHAQPGEGGML